MKIVIKSLAAMAMLISAATLAADGGVTVTVVVASVSSDEGKVMGALCTQEQKYPCKATVSVPAKSGNTVLKFENVKPGVYAFAAMHDANDNKKLDFPKEGFAYGNDARGQYGPPKFADASSEIAGSTVLRVTMNYFKPQQ